MIKEMSTDRQSDFLCLLELALCAIHKPQKEIKKEISDYNSGRASPSVLAKTFKTKVYFMDNYYLDDCNVQIGFHYTKQAVCQGVDIELCCSYHLTMLQNLLSLGYVKKYVRNDNNDIVYPIWKPNPDHLSTAPVDLLEIYNKEEELYNYYIVESLDIPEEKRHNIMIVFSNLTVEF